MYFGFSGFFGFLLLIADVYAVVSVVNSVRPTGNKVLWIILIFLLPALGWLLWFFLGPRARQ
ncbi:MAG: PLDc_N domain-containing protein [Rhodospirillaceae bacterium]|nr:MAG: PLDc_N domain-containing protein [Rhodospirillaceae bacterium]